MSDAPIAVGYKRGMIASTAVLLASLLLFMVNVIAGFLYFSSAATPLWVTVLGGVGIFGIAVGFAGLFLLLAIAGTRRGEVTGNGPRADE